MVSSAPCCRQLAGDRRKQFGAFVARIDGQRRAVERGAIPQVAFVDIGPALEQPVQDIRIGFLGRPMQRSPALTIAGLDQGAVRLKEGDGALVLSLGDCGIDLILDRRYGRVGAAHLLAAEALLFFDDGDELAIVAIPGDDQGRGGIAVRVNAFARVGSGFHEQAHHGRVAAQDRVVQGAMLVAFRQVDANQLRPSVEENARFGQVAGLDCFGQFPHVDSIDEGLELGPAFEAIGPRQDALRIVESE